jgi:DNA-directed RNA polymerase III subunit RPC6
VYVRTWTNRCGEPNFRYKQCADEEQSMVYSLIDEAGGDGIWSQTLQRRLNMHDSVLKNALKQLQLKNLIAPFKNVEHPNKKMYIKASIQPSDRATGGPWYTDQNLDEAFIEELQMVVFDYVKRQSSYYSKHGGGGGGSGGSGTRSQTPKKGVLKGGLDKGKKRDASQMNEPPAKAVKVSATATPKKKETLLPLPAGYTGYPTVRDVARFLSTSGITNNTILSEEDVKKLVDVLVWDNLVEPIKVAGKLGYRVSRVAKQSIESWAGREDPTGRDGGPEPFVSAFTEAPCGRCPVFDLCEDGGPVGPSNCVYYQRWLGVE